MELHHLLQYYKTKVNTNSSITSDSNIIFAELKFYKAENGPFPAVTQEFIDWLVGVTAIQIGYIYIGSIHNHPTNGVAVPSIIDLRLLLNTYDEVNPLNRDEVFVMVVSKESNGNLAVYNLKINDIDKLRDGVNAVFDNPKLANLTEDDKIKAIKDVDADYFSKAGSNEEKAFFQKYGDFGVDLYKSSNSVMDDWGELELTTEPVANTLIVKKSNCN